MILFHYIVEVLALPQANSARERPFRFQPFYRRRVRWILVDVHDPWQGIAGCRQSLSEEPLGRICIPSRGEQKVDRLAHGVDCSIQILVLAFDLYIGLVDPIAFVRGLQMWPTSLIQFWRIGLDPGPDAAGIHIDSAFGQNLGDVFVGQRISQVTSERIKGSPRPGIGAL